ncbi:hypothetical protein [Streptomyces sp. NPDC001137]|uniref:hypothetical protein n=1 Tax=Streptomyces sp. NPDC001137 TaxID=3154378 RepID=UPI00331CADCA
MSRALSWFSQAHQPPESGTLKKVIRNTRRCHPARYDDLETRASTFGRTRLAGRWNVASALGCYAPPNLTV